MASYGLGDGYGSGLGLNGGNAANGGGYGFGSTGNNEGGGLTSGGGGYGLGGGSGGGGFGYGLTDSSNPGYSTGIGSGWGGDRTGSGGYSFGSFGGDLGSIASQFGSTSSGIGFTAPSYSTFDSPASYAAPAWNGSYDNLGLSVANPDSVQLGTPAQDDERDLWGRLRQAGIGILGATPGNAQNAGLLSAANQAYEGNYGNAAGGLVGMATQNGLLGNLTGLGVDAAMGKPVGERAAGTTGSYIGGAIGSMAGPLGAMFGSMAGDKIGRGFYNGTGVQRADNEGLGSREPGTPMLPNALSDRRGTPTNYTLWNGAGGAVGATDGMGANGQQLLPSQVNVQAGQSGKPGALGVGLAGLAQLWALNQQNGANKEYQQATANLSAQQQAQMDQMMQMMPSTQMAMPSAPSLASPNLAAVREQLGSMFGPNSEAAQTMRQTLERKDAAGGRRSQYGPREVELMSALTQLRANAEPNYLNAAIGEANAINQSRYNVYNTQMSARQNEIANAQNAYRNMMQLYQAGGTNAQNALNQQYAAQRDKNTQRQQQLATLYSVGRDTGLFDWVGSYF